MKNKIYLYDHRCDPEAGYSEVSLMTPSGVFKGTAKCNLEEDVFNEITGGTIAELRAWKNYYKHEIRLRKFAVHELNTVYSQMKKNWHREMLANRIAYLELEINGCKNEIKEIDDEITTRLNRLEKLGKNN